jgi:uncharacterized membrane-anchored protein YitT (DUF2179 family)
MFLASCFISLSVGTSVGTIAALVPIAAGVASETNIDVAMMTAIIVGGSFFGDNLSFISDTTIMATQTQGCRLHDKFRVNSFIVMPVAFIILIVYLVIGQDIHAPKNIPSPEWLKVLPYLVVLVTAILGMNVMVVLTFAILFHKYESCMYTMIEMFISSKVINLLLYGSNVSTVCYIISSVPAEISDAINREMHRGVTFLRGQGGWSGHDQPVILCVIKRPEIAQMRALVRNVDEKAFFIVTEAKDVFGKNFENIRQED